MKIKIEPLVKGETSVKVCFEVGEIVHDRTVNAVFTDGVYDEVATAQRVDEVARGVKIKINNGIIKNTEESSEEDEAEAEAQEEFSFD